MAAKVSQTTEMVTALTTVPSCTSLAIPNPSEMNSSSMEVTGIQRSPTRVCTNLTVDPFRVVLKVNPPPAILP